jgi:predicted transcriptional regulator of viral defense system
MYAFLKPLSVRDELLRKKAIIFTLLDFERFFGVSPTQTKYFLEENTRSNLFLRLKNGLYALRTDLPPEEEIANQLYRPSYLSFEYALAAHNILPEMPYAITSATTKPTRVFNVEERTFSYLTIKRAAYAGYMPMKREGRVVLMAEPEKALVDYLYFVSLGKKQRNDRLNTGDLNKQKALGYASLFNRKGLEKIVKETL